MKKIEVENNIKIAETLPSSFYKSEVIFDELKEKVFYKSWQLIDHKSILSVNTNAYPFDFIKDYINEPLVLIKDDNNNDGIYLFDTSTLEAQILGGQTTMNIAYYDGWFAAGISIKSISKVSIS